MKKLVLLFMTFFISFIGYGQTEHLTFQGIQINGSWAEFGSQLVEKTNFKIASANLNNQMKKESGINGCLYTCNTFAGITNNWFLITNACTTEKNNYTMSAVLIYTDPFYSWNNLYKQYLNLKNLYIKKYGDPSITKEYFSDPLIKEAGCEFMDIENGDGLFINIWYIQDLGNIQIKIEAENALSGRITITYSDKINSEKWYNERINSSLNDI